MLKPILELLSSSSEALGFCHRFITGSVPVSFFSSFHSQRIHGSFFFSLFNFQGPSCASRFQSLSALDYLTTFGLICQVLFQLFFAPLAFREVSLSRGLTILPYSARFVKYFFQLFSRSHFSVRGLPFGRLDYLTTLGLICQALFEKSFSPRLSAWLLSRESLTIIPQVSPDVNTFFRFFCLFLSISIY